MKAPNRSKEQPRGKESLYKPAGSSRAETVMFATLGLVALVTIVVALVEGSVPARPGEDPLIKYVRCGQLTANIRTATAVVHYWFEAKPALVSNERATQKHLARPTNNVPVEPTV